MRVLSLGLGVQSTTMLYMAAEGLFDPPPDVAFFADPKAEPAKIYESLARLRGLNSLPFPIKTCSAGDLTEAVLSGNEGKRFASVPFFVKQPDGTIGRGRRQCTKEYKLTPLWRAFRAELGIAPGQRIKRGIVVETWVGITTDEVMRATQSRHKWEHLRYPLIEAGMSRGDCIEWLKRNNRPVPPKSRCKFCPFTSNEEWRRIQEDEPEEWTEATFIDRAIRKGGTMRRGLNGQQYIHRSCVPLDEADLRAPDPRQLVMGDLCGGACGL